MTASDDITKLLKEKKGIQFVRSIVSEYVYTRMPIRMIQLDKMRLVNRNTMIGDITNAIAANGPILNILPNEMRRTHHKFEDAKQAVWKLIQDIAGYAILSHTWLTDESDIVYEDTLLSEWHQSETLHGSKTAGLEKVEQFCKVARESYKVNYGWLDSICINQRSTSELDESIRSMYRWYRDSTICIIHLAETKVTPLLDGMENDRWFTRGWTLQEFLAPARIKFHDQNWTPFDPDVDNDKFPNMTAHVPTPIQKKIEQATGIQPSTAHHGSTMDIEGGHIIQKMRWAAKRETTRAEDRAYSLMGVFGVSISIAYGEGAERAFFRLIEAVLASKPADHILELLAWGGNPIADEIHISRLLPSSPDCYDQYNGDDVTQKIPGRRLPSQPMMLTHIGLRVRLVLVPMMLAAPKDLPSTFNQDNECGQQVHFKAHRPNPLHFCPVNVYLQQQYPSYPTPAGVYPRSASLLRPFCPNPSALDSPAQDDPRFALAIYTFVEDNHEILIPDSGFAFLLGWYPAESMSETRSKGGEMMSPPLNAQSKINTKRPIQFARESNARRCATYIAKEEGHMRAQSVELVTLYL